MTQSPPRSAAATEMVETPGFGTGAGVGPFRINVAAELCGVAPATLRAWERRYGIPVPRRTASAYRLYTTEDVDQIVRMRQYVEEGISPAEAARVVLGSPAAAPDEHVPVDGLELAQGRLISATLRWDAAAIDNELLRLSMLLDAQTLYERVMAPVMVEIGSRWERGELSIGQEHLLTDRLELAVRASLRATERSEGPLVLLACIDLEQHILSLLGAALRFASSGAHTIILGATTPAAAVADAIRSMSPRLVGLSISLPPPAPKALMRAYGKACGTTPWVVGGAAASSLRSAIEDAGGIVAVGPSSEWNSQIRDWLRSPR